MPKTSYDKLKDRWSKDDLLQKAAAHRDALEYKKISFGKLTGQKNYIRLLLPQAHESFYLGNYQSCIAVCGMMLESVLHLKTKSLFNIFNKIEFTKFNERTVTTISIENDLVRLELSNLIDVCKKYRFLSEEKIEDLLNIQKIRNLTIHDKMPFFKRKEDEYILELGRNEIRLKRSDVAPLIQNTASLAAYFCLTRTRMIFHSIVKDIDVD